MSIPIEFANPWAVADLDQDGQIEIVSQWGNELKIHSASGWTLRALYSWSGFNVEMNPVVVNIDDDPYLEVYATPNTLGGAARAVIIKYNPSSGDFEKIADIPAPNGAVGRPAVGDFDEDGRMEFISGNNSDGYELIEWQDPNLVYIGKVGEAVEANVFSAVSCQPMPDGILYALLGSSSSEFGYRYQLLKPTGDNTFELVRWFEEITGWTGIHPCWAADTDCDGLDELVMNFHPNRRVWEWDIDQDEFTQGCVWAAGGVESLYDVDLDQNGAAEWGEVNASFHFRAFPDPDCVGCDNVGACTLPDPDCFCYCSADPQCDDQMNVLDVVTSVDVAFRSGPAVPDPFPQCPFDRTDVNCDYVTSVLDVVRIVNVAFRNHDPATQFCTPCP